MTGIRLVETGLDEAGRSTVVDDRTVDERQLPTGRVLHALWGTDTILSAPVPATPGGLFPGAGGARFWIFTVRANESVDGANALHRTDTVDLGFVISGELTMHLEDSATVHLAAGDAYVQNGTMHAWTNRGAVDATVVLVVLGLAPSA